LNLNILIADDQPVLRAGLAGLLRKEIPGLVVLQEMGTGIDVVDKIADLKPNLVIMELGPQGSSGLKILELLKFRKFRVPVLVFTIQPEQVFGLRCMQAGAAGFLGKECPVQELVRAVREIAEGGRFLTLSLKDKLLGNLGIEKPCELHELLSPREYQIAVLIANGESLKSISTNLDLNSKTVSTYRGRILEKLGFGSNAEVTLYCFNHGLLPSKTAPVAVFR